MKNAFVLSSLVLTAAIATTTLGLASFRLPSFSTAIGAYAALGILAFAFRDYTGQSRLDARPTLQRSPRASTRPTVRRLSIPHSTLHAN